MKRMALAAVVAVAGLAGLAQAKSDDGCIRKPGKPGKPTLMAHEPASLVPLVTVCTNPKGCKPA